MARILDDKRPDAGLEELRQGKDVDENEIQPLLGGHQPRQYEEERYWRGRHGDEARCQNDPHTRIRARYCLEPFPQGRGQKLIRSFSKTNGIFFMCVNIDPMYSPTIPTKNSCTDDRKKNPIRIGATPNVNLGQNNNLAIR